MNPAQNWHPVQLLGRGAIMRQGHSGASGQGDVFGRYIHTAKANEAPENATRPIFFVGTGLLSGCRYERPLLWGWN